MNLSKSLILLHFWLLLPRYNFRGLNSGIATASLVQFLQPKRENGRYIRRKRPSCSYFSYGKVFAVKTAEIADLVNILGRLILLSQAATLEQSCDPRAKLQPASQAATPKPCCDLHISHLYGSLSKPSYDSQAKLSPA